MPFRHGQRWNNLNPSVVSISHGQEKTGPKGPASLGNSSEENTGKREIFTPLDDVNVPVYVRLEHERKTKFRRKARISFYIYLNMSDLRVSHG